MSLIIDGILTQKLPWGLVLLGVSIAIVMELCGVASLPFAVGVYLPLSASTPIFFGGLVRWIVEKVGARRGQKQTAEEAESGPGVLFSSGLIAGGSIAGIGLAILSLKGGWTEALNFGKFVPSFSQSELTPAIMFTLMMIALFKVGTAKPATAKKKR